MIVEVIRGLGLGGAETLLVNRLRRAEELRPAGFEETVVINTFGSASFYAERLRDIGVPLIALDRSGPIRGMLELRRLLRGLREANTVVFHSPGTTYLEKLVRAIPARRVYMMVEVVHTTRDRLLYRIAGLLLDRYADRAIAVSQDVANAATSSSFRRCSTILAGVDADRMRNWVISHPSAPQDFRENYDIPGHHHLVVAVGSLLRRKGHHHAIALMKDPRFAKVTLALVGDGPERLQLEQLAADLGVSARVRFVGRVVDGWQWVAVADVLIHPSHYEGLPVVLMEAAALGTPIVATDVGGARQVMEVGTRGKLVSTPDENALSDALVEVIRETAPIADTFLDRAMKPTYWSIDRYVGEFYATLGRERPAGGR